MINCKIFSIISVYLPHHFSFLRVGSQESSQMYKFCAHLIAKWAASKLFSGSAFPSSFNCVFPFGLTVERTPSNLFKYTSQYWLEDFPNHDLSYISSTPSHELPPLRKLARQVNRSIYKLLRLLCCKMGRLQTLFWNHSHLPSTTYAFPASRLTVERNPSNLFLVFFFFSIFACILTSKKKKLQVFILCWYFWRDAVANLHQYVKCNM